LGFLKFIQFKKIGSSRRVHRFLVTLTLAIIGLPVLAIAENPRGEVGATAYDTSKIEAEFKRQCGNGTFSGVILVRARGRELFSRSCGEADILNHITNTRETRFKIYSTSKLITALSVMRLVEQKRLTLDAPITQYITDAPDAWEKVTLRRLLNHTSGVKDLTPNLVTAYQQDYDTAFHHVLSALTGHDIELDNPPGAHFAYNNFGFELLAMAVERVMGKPFPMAVKELVFDAAGMKTASFQPPSVTMGHLMDTGEEGLAIGYNGEPSKLVQATNWAFVQMGAGAIRASVDDFVALDAALKDGRVVRKATLDDMVRDPVSPPPDYPTPTRKFGLGIFVQDIDGVRLEGHTGGTNGYISDFERFPEEDAMMMALTNRGFVKTSWLREAVAQMLSANKQ
jgi:CubicO group peptidase (beta-lactamase class C family)